MKSDRAHYPTPRKVRDFVALARELGIDVAGIEVSREGAIRVVEARATPTPANDFDLHESKL